MVRGECEAAKGPSRNRWRWELRLAAAASKSFGAHQTQAEACATGPVREDSLRDEKIFSWTHFLVACRDEPCILRMRTHFTHRASEHRLGGRE
jgi:hypothetical protein